MYQCMCIEYRHLLLCGDQCDDVLEPLFKRDKYITDVESLIFVNCLVCGLSVGWGIRRAWSGQSAFLGVGISLL